MERVKTGVFRRPGAGAKSAGIRRNPRRYAGLQEKCPTAYTVGHRYWWWDGTPYQTTIESTESKRCGLLRTSANSIEKPVGTPFGTGRSSKFFALIGGRKGCSTWSAFRSQFNSRNRNRTRVRQIATFHSRNCPTVCVRPCLSRVSRYSSAVLGGFFSERRWLAACAAERV